MSKPFGRIGRFMAGAVTLATLGFGTTQAFAVPQAQAQAAPYCSHDYCDVHCQNYGYLAGHCENWVCKCLTSSGKWVTAP